MNSQESPDELGRMFRQAFTEKTPPSLDIVIMQQIRAEEKRRAYRRMAIAFVLKIAVFFILLLVFSWPVLSRIDLAYVIDHLPESINDAEGWLLHHAVKILVFVGLVLFARTLFNPVNRPYKAGGKAIAKR